MYRNWERGWNIDHLHTLLSWRDLGDMSPQPIQLMGIWRWSLFQPLSHFWPETLSLRIRIHLIFRLQNWSQSESIYLFDWDLIMGWNQNQLHIFALESESISFFVSESVSNYPLMPWEKASWAHNYEAYINWLLKCGCFLPYPHSPFLLWRYS